jgi:hypothetical protein
MKVKVLVDAEVKIDLEPWLPRRLCKTNEQYAQYLERAVEEFQSFLKDHRSQDVNSMHVERIYEDQCSFCESKWDTYSIDGAPGCCNEAQEEWCKENNMIYSESQDKFVKNDLPTATVSANIETVSVDNVEAKGEGNI